jgi:hypothetical protein
MLNEKTKQMLRVICEHLMEFGMTRNASKTGFAMYRYMKKDWHSISGRTYDYEQRPM